MRTCSLAWFPGSLCLRPYKGRRRTILDDSIGSRSAAALGIHGQMIYIDPVRKLVVAINSAWPVATSPERNAVRKEFLKLIAAGVDSEAPR